MYKTNNNKDFI